MQIPNRFDVGQDVTALVEEGQVKLRFISVQLISLEQAVNPPLLVGAETLVPDHVPLLPEELSVHVPDIAPVAALMLPVKLAPEETIPIVIEPSAELWPDIEPDSPRELTPDPLIAPVDEIVKTQLPLSPPENVPE